MHKDSIVLDHSRIKLFTHMLLTCVHVNFRKNFYGKGKSKFTTKVHELYYKNLHYRLILIDTYNYFLLHLLIPTIISYYTF